MLDGEPDPVRIREARTVDDLERARRLFGEYAVGLGLDLSFQGFADELATLPGRYGPPGGRIWLLEEDGEPAGCVALRPIDDEACEMKRLYVRSAFRGRGFGRLLAHTVLEGARELGYARMLLDTLDSMPEAIALYRSLGFVEVAPYCLNPLPGARYFALQLGSAGPWWTVNPH